MIAIKGKAAIIGNAPPHLKKARRHALELLEHVFTKIDSYQVVLSAVTRKGTLLRIKSHKFDLSHYRNIYMVGFGKASGGMARAITERVGIKKGAIITNYKEIIPGVKTYVGSHPAPTQRNITATNELLKIVKNCTKDDLLIVLISGGGSAMFCSPKINLGDIKKVTSTLLKKGCSIQELNTVRGHLSHVKLGGLAAMSKAPIISLIISDVIGDPLDLIASGPTYRGSTIPQDAQNIIKKYALWDTVPSVKTCLTTQIRAQQGNTPGTPDNATSIIIANNHLACTEALTYAKKLGYYPVMLSTSLAGEAQKIGKALVEYAKVFPRQKTMIIAGGETTVVVKGKGKGGRNQELILGAVKDLSDTHIVILSIGTDGLDGPTDAAGAIADGATFHKAIQMGMSPDEYLANNDAYNFFHRLGDLLITGPTGTNIMDLQIVILPQVDARDARQQ